MSAGPIRRCKKGGGQAKGKQGVRENQSQARPPHDARPATRSANTSADALERTQETPITEPEASGPGTDPGAESIPNHQGPVISSSSIPASRHSQPFSSPPNSEQIPCTTRLAHPYRTYNIHALCPSCAHQRALLLAAVQTGNEIQVEDWKWKVKYLSPVPEESRFVNANASGMGLGEWAETMGSLVRGAVDDVLGFGGATERDVDKGKARKKDKKDRGVKGIRGGLPSS